MNMTPQPINYMLTVRGPLNPPTLEAARTLHNETAGSAANVAAARSFGDLSHLVFVPAGPPPAKGAGELMFVDVWNDPMGLMRFFENKDVQKAGANLFAQRDPLVWAPAVGAYALDLAAPAGRNDRYLGILKGTTKNRAAAIKAFDELTLSGVNEARKLGLMSHRTYFRFSPPGALESNEMISVQTWFDAEGMQKFYSDDSANSAFDALFTSEPEATVWARPAGSWVEW